MSRAPKIPPKVPACDVSVVIPLRNEAAHVERCLDSVLGQESRGLSLEVIMVDGLSSDGTREAIQRRLGSDSRLRLLDNPAIRVSPALNIGLNAASGRIVIRMDAHSEYAEDYVSSTLTVLKETGCDAVGGVQLPTPGAANAIARAIAAIQEGSFATGGAPHRTAGYEGPAKTLWLGGFSRAVVERIGGFDEDLFRSEDNDFYQRVRAGGGRLWVSARIRARYVCRSTLRSYAQQCWITGSELAPTLRANPRAMSIRHFAPVLALVGALTLIIVASAVPNIQFALLVLLGGVIAAYIILVIVAAVHAAVRHGIAVLLPAAIAIATAHGSYALGAVAGVMRSFRQPRGRKDRSRVGSDG